jgi:glucose-1-phosphate cytidylyltransferase
MKVVLFCGGLGMRIRDGSDPIPKPLVTIGPRPIIWHLMKYYAHFGHKDFILCLGHRGDMIKSYFRNYDECLSNDFVLSGGGRDIQLFNSDIQDWRITFVDTGPTASVGQRLRMVERYLEGEDVFLANYADGLTDLYLPGLTDYFAASGKTGVFLCPRPFFSFHFVRTSADGTVLKIEEPDCLDLRINGGYFVFQREIFGFLREGEDLVEGSFRRLIDEGRLLGHRYDGFWKNMDTFKDKQILEELYATGRAPWEVWKPASALRE